jgi:dephospho-CoA kinase
VLRVGLTGGLGSGKSTAAEMFRALGAHILSSDAIGRDLMQPVQPVYAAIVDTFGSGIVSAGGQLDRAALARIAFAEGRIAELNALVHPAVIARQEELAAEIAARDPSAIVMVESALIFETTHAGEDGWRRRFDKIILVTSPEEVRVARFVSRSDSSRILSPDEQAALEAEARRRMALQMPDEAKAALADYVLTNTGPITELEWQVDRLWPLLVEAAQNG